MDKVRKSMLVLMMSLWATAQADDHDGSASQDSSRGAAHGSGHADADNTERNDRDRDGSSLTATDQSSDPYAIDLTKRIREALMKDDSLGTNAKNVKVITTNGKVTLRGPVRDLSERAKVVKIASEASDTVPVVDELEVESH